MKQFIIPLCLTLFITHSLKADTSIEAAEAFIRTVLTDQPEDIVKAIKAGANVNQITGTGQPVLCAASMFGKLKAARTLLEQGAELRDECVVAAVANNQVKVLMLFLDKGKSPNLVASENGDRLLHMAVRSMYSASVELLLRMGADRNLTNNDGDKPEDLLLDQREVVQQIEKLLTEPTPHSPNH